MNIEEMESIIRQEGWTPHLRKRYRSTYMYASRREGTRIAEVYLAPLNKLLEMTPDQIISKLRKSQVS